LQTIFIARREAQGLNWRGMEPLALLAKTWGWGPNERIAAGQRKNNRVKALISGAEKTQCGRRCIIQQDSCMECRFSFQLLPFVHPWPESDFIFNYY